VPFVTIALDRASERLARTELQRLAEDRRARLQALLDEFVASDPRESSLALTPCHFRSGGLRYVGCAHTLSATLDQSLPNKVSLERAQEAMQGLARFLTV
jgi:hypothetical protein